MMDRGETRARKREEGGGSVASYVFETAAFDLAGRNGHKMLILGGSAHGVITLDSAR